MDVFIKFPKANGGEDEVQVDPDRHEGWDYQQLYTKSKSRMGHTSFIQVLQHSQRKAKLLFSPAGILSFIDGIVRQMVDALSVNSESDTELQDLIPGKPLTELIQALSCSQIEKAEDILRDWLYGLLGNLTVLSSKLQTLETTVSGMSLAYTHVSNAYEQDDLISFKLFQPWAEKAVCLLKTVKDLRALEMELHRDLTFREEKRGQWQQLVAMSQPDIKQTWEFLSTASPNFLEEAYVFVSGDEVAREDAARMAKLLEEASLHLQVCGDLENNAHNIWAATYNWARERIDYFGSALTGLLADLAKNTKALESYITVFGEQSGLARPYDIGPEKYISQHDYELAESLLKDNDWRPLLCKQRLEGLLGRLEADWEEEPALPSELLRAFRDTEQYSQDIQSKFRAEVSKKKQSAPAFLEPQPVPEFTRATELYELAVAVGFVLTTCDPNTWAARTIKSLLNCIFELGRCSLEEVAQFTPVLEEMICRPGECEATERKFFTPASQEGKTTWVSCPKLLPGPGNTWVEGLKVCASQQSRAIATLLKYNLSVQEVAKLKGGVKKDR